MRKTDFEYDLVSLGELLLRLAPSPFIQLRRASSLNLAVVGSQLNVAANLARLGKRTAFLTKLPANPLGQLALDACRGYGVDVTHIQMMPESRIGTTYVEFSASPRAPVAVYDRANSAASTIQRQDFDWDRICKKSRFVQTDGIFPGLSPVCHQATRTFLQTAQRRKCVTAFDLNFREHLWTPRSARKAWIQLLPWVDVLLTNRDVSERVFGYDGPDEDLMRRYAQDFHCRVVCLTSREMKGTRQGAWNSRALANGKAYEGKRQEFDIVDRYGTGDAWFAGFLYGYMEKGVEFGLQFGNALCALAHTIEGDVAHVTAPDVAAIMDGKVDLRVKR